MVKGSAPNFVSFLYSVLGAYLTISSLWRNLMVLRFSSDALVEGSLLSMAYKNSFSSADTFLRSKDISCLQMFSIRVRSVSPKSKGKQLYVIKYNVIPRAQISAFFIEYYYSLSNAQHSGGRNEYVPCIEVVISSSSFISYLAFPKSTSRGLPDSSTKILEGLMSLCTTLSSLWR